jgi:hypothetical protein
LRSLTLELALLADPPRVLDPTKPPTSEDDREEVARRGRAMRRVFDLEERGPDKPASAQAVEADIARLRHDIECG